jgi:hypothetical protein
MKYGRIQKWKDGEIVKANNKYLFIKGDYTSPKHSTIAELINYELNKVAKPSLTVNKRKPRKQKAKKQAVKKAKKVEELHDES